MGGKNDTPTIGFWYYLDILLTLCHGGVNRTMEIHEIQGGGRTAWSGLANTSKTISIYKKDLYGGEKKEGGLEGNVDIMMGLPDQSINPYYGASVRASGIAGPIPAYRGLLNLFFRGATTNPEFASAPEWSIVGAETRPPDVISNIHWLPTPPPQSFRWSAMNPYFKTVKVLAAGYYNGWYPEKNKIGYDTNPAHIIYETFENTVWGMGYPTSELYDSRMRAVADVLYAEGFGISLEWGEQVTIEDFMKLVLQHVNGILTQDRSTGNIYIKLIRYDYVITDLIELNPSNSKLMSFDRPGTGETVNEVTVVYMGADGVSTPITVQDLASVANQGQIINQTIEFLGITNPELAARIAQRELESHSKPISKIQIVSNRIAAQLQEGDVFKLHWPEQNIASAVYRVGQIDLGNLTENSITIDAIEDVFGLPLTSYSGVQSPGWVEPTKVPAVAPIIMLAETPYYDMARELDAAALSELDATDCALDVYAKEPSPDAYDYNLYTAVDPQTPIFRTTGTHTPTAKLSAALVVEEFSVFTVDTLNDVASVQQISGAYIVCENECMRLDNLDFATNQVTVARGVLDTVPRVHPINSVVWFVYNAVGRDGIAYLPSEVAKALVQTRTPRGTLDIAAVVPTYLTFIGRQNLPYAPGKIRANGVYKPEWVGSPITFTWATRNRLTQTADIIAQDFGSLAPEAGSETTVELIGENGTIFYSTTSTGTTLTTNRDMESASGLTNYSANVTMRSAGLADVVTAESAALDNVPVGHTIQSPMNFVKVDSGWLSLSLTGTFVDSATAISTSRTYDTSTPQTAFALVPSVPQLDTYYNDSAHSPYFGWASYWQFPYAAENTTYHYSHISTPFKDRRVNPTHVVTAQAIGKVLRFSAQSYDDMRAYWYRTNFLNVFQKAAILTGPLAPQTKVIHSYNQTTVDQFDSIIGVAAPLPPVLATNSIFYSNYGPYHGDAPATGVIYDQLIYSYFHRGSGSSVNTSGKPLDVTNIISSGHFTYLTGQELVTVRHTINSSGVLTNLDERAGYYLSDKLNSTQGFEVEFNSKNVVLVNSSTGAAISTLGTLPSNPVAVYGDTTNQYIYVVCINSTIYKYDNTLTLLASINLYSAAANLEYKLRFSDIKESQNKIYVRYSEVSYEVDKDLSTSRVMSEYKQPYPGYADPSSSIILIDKWASTTYGLADETGLASSAFNIPTPRTNDEITIRLGAVRDTANSYQKNSMTVKRSGYGMRYGTYS